jgi:hypothetical protein
LQGYVGAGNWVGLKEFMVGLMQAGVLDLDDYANISNSLKDQGIDIQ